MAVLFDTQCVRNAATATIMGFYVGKLVKGRKRLALRHQENDGPGCTSAPGKPDSRRLGRATILYLLLITGFFTGVGRYSLD